MVPYQLKLFRAKETETIVYCSTHPFMAFPSPKTPQELSISPKYFDCPFSKPILNQVRCSLNDDRCPIYDYLKVANINKLEIPAKIARPLKGSLEQELLSKT
jgi:hypothetical protein